jgi:hypothetical protein
VNIPKPEGSVLSWDQDQNTIIFIDCTCFLQPSTIYLMTYFENRVRPHNYKIQNDKTAILAERQETQPFFAPNLGELIMEL